MRFYNDLLKQETKPTLVGESATLLCRLLRHLAHPHLTSQENMVGSQSGTEKTRSLFGGALTLSFTPIFTDISHIREIPDNQEVFAHAETDRSLIVELLQLETALPPPHVLPATHHFAALARDSAAVSAVVTHSAALPSSDFPLLVAPDADPHASVSVAHGVHVVSKFRDAAQLANRVNVYLACVRLPRAATDLLLVFNDPVALHPDGASARLGSAVADPDQMAPEVRAGVLNEALRTLQIKDWSLFC